MVGQKKKKRIIKKNRKPSQQSSSEKSNQEMISDELLSIKIHQKKKEIENQNYKLSSEFQRMVKKKAALK